MIDLGWTRDEVLDQVDAFFLHRLFDVWRDYPPLRRSVGAFIGYKPKPKPTKNFMELARMFPRGVIR